MRITDFELFPVRASSRTVWLIVRVRTDVGISGLGEASDAFGFANTTVAQARQMELELGRFVQVAAAPTKKPLSPMPKPVSLRLSPRFKVPIPLG